MTVFSWNSLLPMFSVPFKMPPFVFIYLLPSYSSQSIFVRWPVFPWTPFFPVDGFELMKVIDVENKPLTDAKQQGQQGGGWRINEATRRWLKNQRCNKAVGKNQKPKKWFGSTFACGVPAHLQQTSQPKGQLSIMSENGFSSTMLKCLHVLLLTCHPGKWSSTADLSPPNVHKCHTQTHHVRLTTALCGDVLRTLELILNCRAVTWEMAKHLN